MIHNCAKCNQLSVLADELDSCPYCYDAFSSWFRKIVLNIAIAVQVPVHLLIRDFDGPAR